MFRKIKGLLPGQDPVVSCRSGPVLKERAGRCKPEKSGHAFTTTSMRIGASIEMASGKPVHQRVEANKIYMAGFESDTDRR